jgi:hypothetical protein
MKRAERRFARFYYDDFLREYPEIYRDDAAFAAWMRLLVASEQAWPIPPEMPRSAKPSAVRTLTVAGLVAIGPAHTYAIRGHDKERARRHGIAVAAANARANGGANAEQTLEQTVVPSRVGDETRRDSPPPPAGRRANGTNPRSLGTNPRANGTSPRQEREAQRRGPTKLHEILSQAAKAGHE